MSQRQLRHACPTAVRNHVQKPIQTLTIYLEQANLKELKNALPLLYRKQVISLIKFHSANGVMVSDMIKLANAFGSSVRATTWRYANMGCTGSITLLHGYVRRTEAAIKTDCYLPQIELDMDSNINLTVMFVEHGATLYVSLFGSNTCTHKMVIQ